MTNQTSVAITDAALLAGLGSPLTLSNPGWGTFAMGMTALAGGTVAATFGNGDAAIILGNGGMTIINGFLDDTFLTTSEGVTLYTNEINLLLNGRGTVPVPASIALLAIGLVGVGYKRRKTA